MSGAIAGVFFDFGGTLFDYYPSNTTIWSAIAQRLGATVSIFDPRIREGLREWNHAYLQLGKPFSQLTQEELHELNCLVLDVLGIDCEGTMEVIREEFGRREQGFISGDAFRMNPDCQQTLERIRRIKNIRLGLLSNCPKQYCGPRRSLLRRTGIFNLFDGIILSGEVGVSKPDKAIFEIALKELGVKNIRNTIHVGDCLLSDVQGARNAGITPVLFDPLELYFGDDILDVIVVRRLSDIIQYLV
jgi:HAD superfamily hydrolase (TIGR01549 family)